MFLWAGQSRPRIPLRSIGRTVIPLIRVPRSSVAPTLLRAMMSSMGVCSDDWSALHQIEGTVVGAAAGSDA